MLNIKDIQNLESKEVTTLYRSHISKDLTNIFKVLGYNNFQPTSAYGLKLFEADNYLLDFSSGLGVLNLGHNHKVVKNAQQYCIDENIPNVYKLGVNRYQAGLAHNLSQVTPAQFTSTTLATSGAEAIEAAIKLTSKYFKKERQIYLRASNSYHGKTTGALSLTDAENFGDSFHTFLPNENIINYKYNDSQDLEKIVTQIGHNIAAIIIEPIQGQTHEVMSKEFALKINELAKKFKFLILCDEIKSGMWRSGTFLAHTKVGLNPDLITISKSLGGGLKAISAMLTTEEIFTRAYRKKSEANLHTSTFSGMGHSCVIASQVIAFMAEPEFTTKLKDAISYAKVRLQNLKNQFPNKIISIDGDGLLLGLSLDLNYFSQIYSRDTKIILHREINILLMASILNELRKKKIYTCFSGTRPNLLYFMPPLIVNNEEIDQFIEAVQSVLDDSTLARLIRFTFDQIK